MTDHALKFRRVDIQRLLGIRPPHRRLQVPSEDNFSDFINLVYGPNASGKTTTALALQTLAWPEADSQLRPVLSGDFDLAHGHWHVDVLPGQVTYLKDGTRESPPELPSPDKRHRYRLALHELLKAEDKDLAALVQNEIDGGLDLQQAAVQLQFSDKIPGSARKECKILQEATKRVRTSKDSQRDLKRQEEKLADLDRQLTEVQRAVQEVELLKAALAFLEAQSACELAREELDAFEPAIERLGGDEDQELAQIHRDRQENERRLHKLRSARQSAERERDNTGLTEQQLPTDARLDALGRILNDIDKCEQSINATRRDLAGANKKRRDISARLGSEPDEQFIDTLAPGDVFEYVELLRKHVHATAQLTGTKKALELLQLPGEFHEGPSQRDLQWALDRLGEWLRFGTSSSARPMLTEAAWTGAGLAMALTLLLATQVHPAWLIASVAPLALGAWLIRIMLSSSGAAKRRSQLEKEYAERAVSNIPLPDSWSESDVKALWNQLERDLAQQVLRELKERTRDGYSTDHDAQQQQVTELEAAIAGIAEHHGLSVEKGPDRVGVVLSALSEWQQATAGRTELEGRLEGASAEHQTLLGRFNETLHSHSEQVADDHYQARELLEDLRQRATRFQQSTRLIEDTGRGIADTEKAVASLRGKYDNILRKIAPDLPSPSPADARREAEQRLPELLRQRDDFRKARESLTHAKHDVSKAEQEFRTNPLFDETLLETPQIEIKEQLQTMQATAAKHGELSREKGEIEGRIKDAKQRHDLERDLTDQANAKAGLARVREQTVQSVAGNLIVNHIRKRNEANASQVMQRAQSFFGQICKDRYEVRVENAGSPVFLARDVESGQVHDLDQLSSGTRVQLLLAMRVAFLEMQEGAGPRLPLILDEVLGNSDDERASAIITALLEIARSGRQVFYFTAQRDELAKWTALLKPEEYLDCKLVCLDEMIASAEESPELPADFLPPDDVPAPDSLSYDEYKDVLGVGAPSLENLGQLHLWYVLDSAEQLHSFLRLGYRFWGQLEQLLNGKGPAVLEQLGFEHPERLAQRAGARAEIVRAFGSLWRVGRGKNVTRATIFDSPIADSTLVEDVVSCAEEQNGDAKALIEALENRAVKGFRSSQTDKLKIFLEEEGYLDLRPPVDPDALKARIYETAAPHISKGTLQREDVRELLARIAGKSA